MFTNKNKELEEKYFSKYGFVHGDNVISSEGAGIFDHYEENNELGVVGIISILSDNCQDEAIKKIVVSAEMIGSFGNKGENTKVLCPIDLIKKLELG